MFDATWNELPTIVASALSHLRLRQRERWRRYDDAGLVDTLAVHGIWIDDENGSPTATFPATSICASRAGCVR